MPMAKWLEVCLCGVSPGKREIFPDRLFIANDVIKYVGTLVYCNLLLKYY